MFSHVFFHGSPNISPQNAMDSAAKSPRQAALRDVGGWTLSGNQCNSSMHIPKASVLHLKSVKSQHWW
jgi:hypothetical protein